MDCNQCRVSWKAEHENQFEYCPFCAGKLPNPSKRQEKESFYFVWGSMHEETLRKSKAEFDEAIARQALENYLKAVLEDSRYCFDVAAFLETWPLDDPSLDEIEMPATIFGLEAFQNLDRPIRAAAWLYGRGMVENHPESGQRLLHLLKAHLSEPEFEKTAMALEAAFHACGLLDGKASQIQALKAAFAADLKQYDQACDHLCMALNDQKGPVLIFKDQVIEQYTGIPFELEKRISYIQEQLERSNLKNALNALYRPVSAPGHEFDHQNAVFEQAALAIENDFEQFEAVSKEWLDQKMFLRGMHLFLQMMANARPERKEKLQPLLDLHYEKVYMQPFAWIEKTDWSICPGMLNCH